MRENNWRQQRSPSPNPTTSMLPPLSKFYYGPAQGWHSNESSPSHNGSTGSLNPNHDKDTPPALPPCQMAGQSTHRSLQPSQRCHSPAPQAPTAGASTNMTYMSDSLALEPCASDATIDPTWDSGPPAASIWSVKKRQKYSRIPEPIPKPPLPPRAGQQPNQLGAHEYRLPASRSSATTIDVPLFLQPVAYDPVFGAPMPKYSPILHPNYRDQTHSPPEPQRLPPPPPRKIPLDNEDEPKIATLNPERQQHSMQNGFGGDQQEIEYRLRRSHLDPQHLHDDLKSPPRRQHQEQQQLIIPAPQFTKFDIESGLSSVRSHQEPPLLSQLQQSKPTHPQQNFNADCNPAGQFSHQPSTSPLGPNDQDHWAPMTKPWGSQAAYASFTERQHGVLPHQDGHSTSNTDLSSNTAGKSTPESQQTSNTSYRASGDETEQSRHDQEGDDSFYWHSGRSSSGAEEGHSQSSSPAATPGQSNVNLRSSTTNLISVPHQHPDLPPRSTSLSLSNPASYGASALGFGGPSDWEYFGDYEGEEVDDEELYSRLRPRDSVSAIEGSAELPADPPSLGLQQRPNQSELHTSRPMTRKTPPLPDDSLTLQQAASCSQGHIMGVSRLPIDGDYAAKPDTVSEQSPIASTPLSGDHIAPSGMPPEMRKELDGVIQVWSEAPFAAQLKDDGSSYQDNETTIDEPPDVAEASLASTPRARMFGVDVILKNAPSLPRLPALTDQAKCLEIQTQHSSMYPTVNPDVQSIPQDFVEQKVTDSLPQKVESVSENPSPSSVIVLADDELSSLDHARNNSLTRDTETSSNESLVSPHLQYSSPTEPLAASKFSLRHSASVELSGGSIGKTALVPQESPQMTPPRTVQLGPPEEAARQPAIRDVAGEVSDGTMIGRPRTNLQPFVQDVVKKLSSSHMNNDHSVDHPTKKFVPLCHKPTRYIRSGSLQEITSSGLRASLETLVHGEPIGNSEKLDHAEPSQDRSLEERKTSQAGVGIDNAPTGTEFDEENDALEQLTGHVGALEERHQSNSCAAPDIEPIQAYETSRKTDKASDPYADLDPWGKASLNRFAAMLREEARTESSTDKVNIFNVFTSRESRLRVVLYGTEDELIVPEKRVELQKEILHTQKVTKELEKDGKPEDRKSPDESSIVKQAVQPTNTIELHRSLKALPDLPSNRDSVIGLPGNALISFKAQSNPGVKPIVAHLPRKCKQGGLDVSKDIVASVDTVTRADAHHPPSFDAPATLGFGDPELGKLSHTPFEHTEPRSEVKKYLANRKSVVRPYATLTQDSLGNGSTFGRTMEINPTPSTTISITAPTSQHDLDLPPKGDDASDVAVKAKDMPNDNLRHFTKADFDPLLTVLPSSEALVIESPRLLDLRHIMEVVPDDFSFIHQSVVAWDAKNKEHREEHDRQRHARQIESEQRIDSLFDDHEIGYGDISELESEFKRSEAARKADEDRSEYQMFISDVFNLVWTRLHYELDQLIPHYEEYSKLMNDALAGKDMFDGSSDSLALGPTMSAFLGLHQKLEIRHQKAFEAVLERDRRMKKTEISPWYTLSNITKVKQLEKQFEDAEKKAIIEYCEDRNARANQLMDVLDQNTLRGVGANQDYMEAIMKAVRRIASGRAFASVAGSNEPTAGTREVEKAKRIATLLATSSEQIVQTFHVADMLLNSADYEVSVARAKVAKADVAALINLKEERTKEDQKLMRDLEHRLALIREDSRKTNDEIVKLMLFLGIHDGAADGGVLVQTESGSGAAYGGHEA